MHDSTLPIYPHCAICDKTIEEIGGRKLTNTRKPISQEKRQHIDAIIAQGFTPWFCQKCVGAVCKYCGEPWTNPMSHSVFKDDGSLVHCAVFPYYPSCINTSCKNVEKDVSRLKLIGKK